MPARSRRSLRNARHAGVWPWFPLALAAPVCRLEAGLLVFSARDPAVSAVRSRLRASGACSAEDGGFGPITRTAVRRFQRAHGPAADGVVGRATWEALVSNGRQRSRAPSR